MIVLPDEDEPTVGAQVNAVIGEALRRGVAGVEPSPGFEARLSAALDEAARVRGRAGSDGGPATRPGGAPRTAGVARNEARGTDEACADPAVTDPAAAKATLAAS